MLGTAQFGAGYGITNRVGRLSDAAVAEVCEAAIAGGVCVFDTSPFYGDAQQRLGELTTPFGEIEYVSKFGLPDYGTPDGGTIIDETLRTLGVDRLRGMLFHRVQDLRDPRTDEVWALLRSAQADGTIGRIGASVYDLADLEAALRLPGIDLVQLPGNLLDRRLIDHPVLQTFHDDGGEVHVRSAYLQGVILCCPSDLPEALSGLRPVLIKLRDSAREAGHPLIELALGFLKHHPVVDSVVVGALTADEIAATIEAWDRAPETDFETGMLDPALLDPRSWQREGGLL